MAKQMSYVLRELLDGFLSGFEGQTLHRPQIPMNLMSSDEAYKLVTSKISLLFIQSSI